MSLALTPLFLNFALLAATPAPSGTSAPTYTGSSSADLAGRAGSFQLFLEAPPLVTDTLQAQRGFAINQSIVGSSGTYGTLGISGGVGYTLTSLFEFGGAVSISYSGRANALSNGDEPVYAFSLEPFAKFNFGPSLNTGAINPFVLTGFAFGAEGFNNGQGGTDGAGLFALDVDPGVEWLFGGRWGVDFYLPIQILFPVHDNSQIAFTLGVGYGLVGYL